MKFKQNVLKCRKFLAVSPEQVYAWGDNDHGQQGNGTTTVNRKPTLVQGLEGQKITRVACGSSHSVAWTTVDVATPAVHEPVLFQTARDPVGASYLGNTDLHFLTPSRTVWQHHRKFIERPPGERELGDLVT